MPEIRFFVCGCCTKKWNITETPSVSRLSVSLSVNRFGAQYFSFSANDVCSECAFAMSDAVEEAFAKRAKESA